MYRNISFSGAYIWNKILDHINMASSRIELVPYKMSIPISKNIFYVIFVILYYRKYLISTNRQQ